MLRYFILYKPFGVVSQFSGEDTTLGSLYDFPKDVYPVGRLDKDSEGLLIITNDKHVHHRLTDPKFGHKRTYWVQVEGIPNEDSLHQLRSGVIITLPDKSTYTTRPCEAEIILPPTLPERMPPIRVRKSISDTWLSIQLTEGKNRQVRKMTASIGHPTLRLVRTAIVSLTLEGMAPGEVKEITPQVLYKRLQLS
jgi:23S rRNA pseudouridine2457 synthase